MLGAVRWVLGPAEDAMALCSDASAFSKVGSGIESAGSTSLAVTR